MILSSLIFKHTVLAGYAGLYVLTLTHKLFTENQIKVLLPSCLFEGRDCIPVWAESVCVDGGVGTVGKGFVRIA